MRVIFVTGPPWSGKTTQALLLARQLGYEYCSPGDWLRIERDRDSHLGLYINQNYSLATIDPLVTDYVASKIREAAQLMHAGLLVDGFPRTAYQAARLPLVCSNHEFLVFVMDQVSREEATRRALIKTWTPPIGSLPAATAAEAAETEDYHVLTVEDTQRRYDGACRPGRQVKLRSHSNLRLRVQERRDEPRVVSHARKRRISSSICLHD